MRLCRAVCFTSKIVIAQQCHSTERSVSCQKIQFSAKQVSLYTAVCFTSKHSKCKTGVTLQSCLFHVKNSQYKTGVTLQSGLFHDKYTVNTKQVSLYRAVCFTTNIQSMQNRCHSTVRSVSRQKHSQCKKGVTLQSCLFHVKNSQYKTGVILQSCLFHVRNTANAKKVSLYRAVCFTLKTVNTKQVSLSMCSKTPKHTDHRSAQRKQFYNAQ